MAVQFIKENPNLILIGTTHPRDVSLGNSKITFLKIYDSDDGVANEKTILENNMTSFLFYGSVQRIYCLTGSNHN